MTIQEINKNLEIKSVKGLKFGNKLGHCKPTGLALYHKDLGFLSFKEDNKEKPHQIPTPYSPRGGKKALKSILENGGFTNYDSVEWIQPI